jgi:hypothetical protein
MVSRWRDRAAFTAYMRSDAHRISHDRIPPELQAAIKLEKLEHLHTHEVVAERGAPSRRALLRALPRGPRALRRRGPRMGGARHAAPAPPGDRRRRGLRRHAASRRLARRRARRRDFPLEHLAANLELAADVVEDEIEQGPAVADRLRAASITVRER